MGVVILLTLIVLLAKPHAIARFCIADLGIGLKVLARQGVEIDTTIPSGKLIFGIFASLAEFERELIREHTWTGLAVAPARGRKGGGNTNLPKPGYVWRKRP